MNLPNKITILRILLIPVFMIIMYVGEAWGVLLIGSVELPVHHLIATLLFILASATDWIDGFYARKYNLVTDLGKLLDPLADKLLVSAAFIILVEIGLAPSWMVIVIISREFAVTGLRLILAGGGEIVAAAKLGKIKTWAQITAISALLLHNLPFEWFQIPFATLALWVALFFTLWSGWDYFYKNRQVLLNSR